MDTLERCKQDGLFPITLHNYTGFGDIGGRPETVDHWAELGITVGKTPAQSGGEAKPLVLAMLDHCAERGMKCFVNDNRAAAHVLMEEGEDAFRRGVEAALKDYGDHPALFGFEVGDEPAQKKIGPVFRANGIQREMAPHLTPFLSIGGYSPHAIEWMELRSYGRYLDELAEVGKANLFFHNNYALAAKSSPTSMEDYFLALKMYADVSKRHGDLPLWVTLCCTAHGDIPCPNDDDIRWQLNTAAACGFKGVAWYLLYMSIWQNYRNAPFNEHEERTETFAYLSRVQRTFNAMHGSTLVKLTFQRAFFVGGSWGGWPAIIDSELVKAVKVFGDAFPVIVSEFNDAAGRDYVSIVNNSGTGSGAVLVTWHGQPEIYQIGWEGAEGKPRRYVDDDWPGNPAMQTGLVLSPGGMELYRVASDAPERL